jgi:type II secretory pathway pseudopilin PulG
MMITTVMKGKQCGFTITEVMLFLAVSGALFIAVLGSVSGTLDTTRFGDDINTANSYLQRQYNEVVSGKNSRSDNQICTLVGGAPTLSVGASVAGTGECMVIGRLLTFDVGNIDSGSDSYDITSRYIVSANPAAASGVSETDKINSLHPTAFDQIDTTGNFRSSWGAVYSSVAQGASPINSVAIIRSPISGEMMIYNIASEPFHGNQALVFSSGRLNQPITIKLDSAGYIGSQQAQICIGSGRGQNIIWSDTSASPGACL